MKSRLASKWPWLLLLGGAVLLPTLSHPRIAGAAPQDKVAAPAEAPTSATSAAAAAVATLAAPKPPVKTPAPASPAPPPDFSCTAPLPLPSSLAFNKSAYELLLGGFLRNECYRLLGWQHDAELRATGPTSATLQFKDDPHLPSWVTTNLGTHGVVAIYYSKDVYRWLCEGDAATERHFVSQCKATCQRCRLDAAELARQPRRPIEDGSMIVKLMYGNTTEEILQKPPIPRGQPTFVALMVKDSKDTRDGWFWGSWDPNSSQASQLDWPPPANLPYPWMGSGYYCLNCHASAAGESTFSHLNNILGNPDTFLKYYFQDQPPIAGEPQQEALQTLSAHERFEPLEKLQDKIDNAGVTWNKVPWPNPAVLRVSQPILDRYSPEFLHTFGAGKVTQPNPQQILAYFMPPEVYDHAVAKSAVPPLFLTSDQCLGCHAAGSTGLHFDMTVQQPDQQPYRNLINIAPYGEWRSSPMGLAGRDPIFFSQLETEQAAHPALAKLAPDVCLHCHGVMGQRQFCLDQFPDPKFGDLVCSSSNLLGLDDNSQPIFKRQLFSREQVKATPFLARTPEEQKNSLYGGLARDGVSCNTCHHIDADPKKQIGDTFTGDFKVGAADAIQGPFEKPQPMPMDHTLAVKPVEYPLERSSRVCGSCHSVVLPVFNVDKPYQPVGAKKPEIILEQGTYPEWIFSDYRDGGPTPRSCQNCHMGTDYPGVPGALSTKMASIQEASNMPQTEGRLPASDIDLQPRSPFARHTLVGLNVFFNLFAQQFPDILGIRIQDPMLGTRGVTPLQTTYDSMIQQADSATATVSIPNLSTQNQMLVAKVRVLNKAGHKFPSGVSFRRAFLTFEVLDANGNPLWVSGRVNSTGVIVDANGQAIDGEFTWLPNCGDGDAALQKFQPHYQTITREDQTQIYQELVRDPQGKLTTSFLSLANVVKDNRLLPNGWTPTLKLAQEAGLGSKKYSAADLVEHVMPDLPDAKGGKVDDPWYKPKAAGGLGGGGDEVSYAVPLGSLKGKPASVRATLSYQAIPPFYLQDRFCTTPNRPDTARLFFVAGHVNLDSTRAQGWKLQVVSSGAVPLGGTTAASR
jgi:hypothetical protein